MEIQRAKFLLLASALAAPGCVTTVTDNTQSPDGGSTGGSNAGTGGKGTGGATGGTNGTGGSVGTGGSTGGTDGSLEGADASTGGAKTDGGKPSDGAVSIDVNRPDGSACSDDVIEGGLGNCALLQADSCAYADFQVAQCNGAQESMKPFIAQLTIDCILSNATACDPTKTYNCKDQALRLACADPTADTACATIRASCGADAGGDDCRMYLNGLNATGRAKMVACMQQNCSFGIYSCVEGSL